MAIMGGILLTKITEKFVDVVFNYLADKYGRQTGMKAEVQSLNALLLRIQTAVNAAENAAEDDPELLRRNPGLREWLWQLKDAAYEADDMLDELDYLRLQKQVEKANTKDQDRQNIQVRVSNSLARAKNKAFKICKGLCKSDPTLKKLRAVVEKMDGIADHVGEFLANVNTVQQPHQLHQAQVVDRETGPLLPGGSSGVLGRDAEREEVVQWLMKPSDEDGENSVPLFSVVGAGGMGKTTLSQFVFNDERVQKFFDLKIWVCVSTNFDTSRLLAAVIESATNKKPEVESLPALQKALQRKLDSSEKFLLVLDDAWNDDNRPGWDNLLAPLKCGKKGSKILLTTRSDRVAEMAAQAATWGQKYVMKLARLEDHLFISLFYQYAFAGLKSGDYAKLQSIGEKIAERLGGSPLAAKSIGALLNSKLDDQHWENILQMSCILDAQQAGQDNIKSILMLSYIHLPAHLRSCFAYCSIFPQDYEIDKMTLIRMWVGVGLIQRSPQNQSQTDEDIGGYYFDDLLKRSFFEPHQFVNDCCAMHDLLHELAQSVSQDECFRAVDDTSIQGIRATVRHLWVEIDNPDLLIKVDKWKDLRTLVLISKGYKHQDHCMIVSEVLRSLKSIRVLHLLAWDLKELPDEIGQLIHLRVLSTCPHRTYGRRSSNISRLPSLICKLYHLHFIELYDGRLDSDGIPQGMNNLISLKQMRPKHILNMIDGIGKLISLHELAFFIKEKSGHRIEELKDLNKLRTLQIKGLENVKSHKEASMAELHNKGQLLRLELEWGPSRSPDELVEHEEILDCLQPHSDLKELSITRYRGGRHAKWMEYEFIKNLEKIVLRDLHRLECLPCLKKLPYLKFLCLENIPKVKQLDCEGGFPQLKQLKIRSLDELEEWAGVVENLSQWCPRLQELSISDCPSLKVLPCLPLSLQQLSISGCPSLKVLPCLPLSLQQLSISDCPSLKVLPCLPLSLQQLSIRDCPSLKVLPCLPLSLQELFISDCPSLKVLPCLPLSLQELSISGCPSLKVLPCLPLSLQKLSISGCPSLKVLPCLPLSLQELFISGCPRLKVLPSLPLGLAKLELDNVGLTTLPSFWPASNNDGSCSSSTESSSSSLSTVRITNCEQLTSLARGLLQHHLPSLYWLDISNCKRLVDFPTEGLQHLSSLNALRIEKCPKLQQSLSVIPAVLPLSLRVLHIDGFVNLGQIFAGSIHHLNCLAVSRCPKIVEATTAPSITGESFTLTIDELIVDDPLLLLTEHLRNFTSVKNLKIEDCSRLDSLVGEMETWLLQNSATLESVDLRRAVSLQSLPPSIQALSSLKFLYLNDIDKLPSLPQLPSSMERLMLYGCNDTLKERCQKHDGADWPNIKHIRQITINNIFIRPEV